MNDENLDQFYGTENWYLHSLVKSVLYTDGARYVATTYGAYWLLDEIALAQKFDKKVAAEEFQVWTLKVNDDHSATLVCTDGNDREVFLKKIPFTDFKLASMTLWCTNNVIMLPTEY